MTINRNSLLASRPWPPYTIHSACGHIERHVVSVNYPMTEWCEKCRLYVTVGWERRA